MFTTKVSALDGDGDGFLYRGSLTYRKEGDGISLESAQALSRWSAPDPLSEKYYGISPYAFCANDPVNLVERDGRAWDVVWDVASVGFGIHNLVKNLQSGNVDAAIDDGVGIAVDLVSAFIPFVPGGVGAVRAGAKAVNAIDNAADATKTTKTISETANHVHGAAKAFNGQADTYS